MSDSYQVLVLNQIYSVNTVFGLAENTGADGVCDNQDKTIELDADLSLDDMRRVLLHELMHAYLFESGAVEFIDEQAEEMICQSLSGFLNGVMEWKIKE